MFNPTENAAIDIEQSIEFFARVPHGGLVAPPPPKPRRGPRALAGRGTSWSGSLSVTTTDALFAGKVQCKVSNGVAGLAAAGSLEAQNRGKSCHLND
jgi:hypothetical protein